MDPNVANPNLVLRAYRGPEDHPAMTRVAAAVRAYNGEADLGTVADMDNHYAHLDQEALPHDCTLVELDGQVVAYGRASWQDLANGEGRIDAILSIEPEVRGRAVEVLLGSHAVRRAARLIAHRGAERTCRLIVYVTGRDAALAAYLEAVGLRKVRRGAQLIRPSLEDIPTLPLPAGFEIRPIDQDDHAMHRRVFDADARAFADSYGQEAPSEAAFEEFIRMPGFDPALWRVAFHGDEIAGQILSYRGEPVPNGSWIGWTEAISVQREHRRRGLARALLAESLRAVRDAGATSAGLGVDTQNPNQALTLYQSLGFRIVSEMFEYQLGPFAPGTGPTIDPETSS